METSSLRPLLVEIRQNILSAPDTVCLERPRLVTEAYQMFANDPVPIRRARALNHILQHMTLDLESNPVFAGNMSSGLRAWMLLPEYGIEISAQALIENPRLEGLLDGDAVPADIRAYWQGRAFGGASGWGHLAVDNTRILSEGLDSITAEAEEFAGDPDPQHAIYRQAMVIACRAVAGWAGLYASAAGQLADQNSDPQLAALHRRVAQACRQVPAKPARDLFEALQSLLLVDYALHIEGHGYSVSPGRLDQDLLPYYREDEDTVELLAAFILKLSANAWHGSHSKTQPLTIGGVDIHGHDACNPLTLHILEACELARMPDPTVFLRWHKALNQQVKHKAVTMLGRGFSLPLLMGDEQTISGLVNAGVALEDAADYCIIGCNELGIPGRLIWDAVVLPEAGLLQDILLDENNAQKECDMPSLLAALKARVKETLRQQIAAHQAYVQKTSKMVPTPFTSALMRGCIQRGEDHFSAMPYTILNVRSSGFTNLVNGLAAVEIVIFKDRRASLEDLRAALSANFTGHEALHQQLLAAPKWGNDVAEADRWAESWLAARQEALDELQDEFGIPLVMEMVVRSLHHLEGRSLGATPDGRLAGAPLADSAGAQAGTARRGPTALLSSVCKMQPARFWGGGYNLNLTLPLAVWEKPEMISKLSALVDSFFTNQGQELQINSLDARLLRQVLAYPEQHGDLMVRIAGFNARFVDLSQLEQEEIIARAEAITA
jgi:formate C-acetyltransferase